MLLCPRMLQPFFWSQDKYKTLLCYHWNNPSDRKTLTVHKSSMPDDCLLQFINTDRTLTKYIDTFGQHLLTWLSFSNFFRGFYCYANFYCYSNVSHVFGSNLFVGGALRRESESSWGGGGKWKKVSKTQ